MTKLIECLIENNYKEANDVLKEKIAEIVERKMCEMKKMMSARVSEEHLDEGIMSSIKRRYKKASGEQQWELERELNRRLDARQKKILGRLTKDRLTKDNKTLKSDYAELGRDRRYNELNDRLRHVMHVSNPVRPHGKKYLSGRNKNDK
jgi:ribosomal protein L16 Arg81 hydroxylase